jgi:hypothetical protein
VLRFDAIHEDDIALEAWTSPTLSCLAAPGFGAKGVASQQHTHIDRLKVAPCKMITNGLSSIRGFMNSTSFVGFRKQCLSLEPKQYLHKI